MWLLSGSVGKESAHNAGDLGLIPGLGRSPGEGNGYPLQCSCLENPMDRGAWWARVNGVTKSQTRLPRKENSLSSEQWNIERVCITSQSMLKGKPISFSQFLFLLSESGPGVTILSLFTRMVEQHCIKEHGLLRINLEYG